MMNEFIIGGVAVSTAGHDTGKSYVIIEIDEEYLYLVDGRIRTLDRPKKKKLKHVKMLNPSEMQLHTEVLTQLLQELAEKVRNKSAKNEEIKRVIKLLYYGNSSKEAENVQDRCC